MITLDVSKYTAPLDPNNAEALRIAHTEATALYILARAEDARTLTVPERISDGKVN